MPLPLDVAAVCCLTGKIFGHGQTRAMPIKKKGGMGRVGQCPLRNLVAWALPIGQWALNGHMSFTTLSNFCTFMLKSKGFCACEKMPQFSSNR